MPRTPLSETQDQRTRRLQREADYRRRCLDQDPELHRQRQRDNSRRYRQRNADRAKAAVNKWRDANRPKHNEGRRRWRAQNIVRALFLEARSRAKARGVEFSITLDDIPPMGAHCPLLGHPWPAPEDRKTPMSPSLDRIEAPRGYVRGNVWIVGRRANLLKNDGTAEEHEKIAAAMRARLISWPASTARTARPSARHFATASP